MVMCHLLTNTRYIPMKITKLRIPNIYKFELIRKFEIIDTDLNVSLEMPLDRRKVVLTTNYLKQFLHVKPIHTLEISYQASKNQISKNMF
jgi:hypothetical protein